MKSQTPPKSSNKRRPRRGTRSVEVDIASLLSIENRCTGCQKGEPCCCSDFEVCITVEEMKRIIRVLPEAAKYNPRLRSDTDDGFENMFDEEGSGIYSIDTDDDGLCLFGYWLEGRTHCSLHSAAVSLGLPLGEVKPKVCLLWPMHISSGRETLGIAGEMLRFRCNTRAAKGVRRISPGFIVAIDQVYGRGCGMQVANAAAKGERRLALTPRR